MNTEGGLYVEVLGHCRIITPTDVVYIEQPQHRAIVAALAEAAPHVVSVDRLMQLLWDSDEMPRTAADTVRSHIWRIRSSLGNRGAAIRTQRGARNNHGGYALHIGPHESDAGRFSALQRQGLCAIGRGNPSYGVEQLRDALMLWQGDAFGGGMPSTWAADNLETLWTKMRGQVAAEAVRQAYITGGSDPAMTEVVRQVSTASPYAARALVDGLHIPKSRIPTHV